MIPENVDVPWSGTVNSNDIMLVISTYTADERLGEECFVIASNNTAGWIFGDTVKMVKR